MNDEDLLRKRLEEAKIAQSSGKQCAQCVHTRAGKCLRFGYNVAPYGSAANVAPWCQLYGLSSVPTSTERLAKYTAEQCAAYLTAVSVRVFGNIQGMVADNLCRESAGNSPAYDGSAFADEVSTLSDENIKRILAGDFLDNTSQ